MKHCLNILLVVILVLAVSCKSYEPLPTVDYVDLEKYQGLWYEQARLPTSFQKDCECSSAEYTLIKEKDYLSVLNKCTLIGNEKTKEASGKAFVKDEETNSKLLVQFFWPFKGKYWIIDLASDYSYVMVGHPNREYLWILSREKYLSRSTFNQLLNKAKNLNFKVEELIINPQGC